MKQLTLGTTVTIRQELAARLRAYRKAYGSKRPESYNAKLGIGMISKSKDRPFSGFSIRLATITIDGGQK